MNFRTKDRRRGSSEVNLTPLVDIVFILLIFFLITSTFVQNPGIEVDLPKAKDAPSTSAPDSLVLAITSDGRIIHQGRAMSEDELEQTLKDQLKNKGERVVVVQADQTTAHGRVVEIMDIARQSGFKQLAIATELGE